MLVCPLHGYAFYTLCTWRKDIQKTQGLGGDRRVNDEDGAKKYPHVVEATTVGEGA